MKKIFSIFAACCAMALCACCNSNNDGYATQEASQQTSSRDEGGYAQQSRSSSSSSSSSSNTTSASEWVGTYKFQDFAGKNWKLVLKADETAVISLNGEEIDWGTWTKYRVDDYATVHFSLDFDNPRIKLEKDDDFYSTICIRNGYIYTGSRECEANHPKKRLKYNFKK